MREGEESRIQDGFPQWQVSFPEDDDYHHTLNITSDLRRAESVKKDQYICSLKILLISGTAQSKTTFYLRWFPVSFDLWDSLPQHIWLVIYHIQPKEIWNETNVSPMSYAQHSHLLRLRYRYTVTSKFWRFLPAGDAPALEESSPRLWRHRASLRAGLNPLRLCWSPLASLVRTELCAWCWGSVEQVCLVHLELWGFLPWEQPWKNQGVGNGLGLGHTSSRWRTLCAQVGLSEPDHPLRPSPASPHPRHWYPHCFV